MTQTPAHNNYNPDLLKLIPTDSKHLIEVGCSYGALAREYKKINPKSYYVGIDIENSYLDKAKEFCDKTESLNINNVDKVFYENNKNCDCWIFGDTLEHTIDPWEVLKNIRKVIPTHGCVIACIPNVQHWSIQAKISIGDFRYQDSGLLDKTHLRWFTRQTINELFINTGFKIIAGQPRIFNEPDREHFLPIIKQMALKAGAKEHQLEAIINDTIPLQYVVKATID